MGDRVNAALERRHPAIHVVEAGMGEERRQLVLEYVGHEVGTVGPFAKNGLRELDVLSEKDRREAAALIEHGAIGFLVIEPNAGVPNRIVVVSGKRIVGDFPAPKKGA